MKILMLLILVPISHFSQVSDTTLGFSFSLGGGATIPTLLENVNESSEYDAFSLERKGGGYFSLYLGYRYSAKWSTFVGVDFSSLRLKKVGYINRLEQQYSNSFVYHDFDEDATNSSPVGLSFVSFSVRQFYRFDKWKLKLFPSIGLGMRYVGQRDFSYAVRSKSGNFPLFYDIGVKKRLSALVSPELAFTWNNWGVIGFVKTEFGTGIIKYQIDVSDSDGIIDQRDYTMKLNYIPVIIGVRI